MTGRYEFGEMAVRWLARMVAQGRGAGHGGGHQPVMHFWGGGIIMWIVFLIVVGVLVYFLTQNGHSRPMRESPGDTALEILEKRYARGEITKDEFERMREAL